MSRIEKAIINITKWLCFIGMSLLFVMMIMGAFDVIGRYIFNSSIIGTMERNSTMLALVVCFTWGYTQVENGHVNVELFLNKMPSRVQAVINFITTLISLCLFGLIAWESVLTSLLYNKQNRLIYVIHWPLAPFQLCVTFGAVVLCLVLIFNLIHLWRQVRGEV
jgi:TRAP-type C4-dicarboxylate transport system permease small subunit